MRRLAWFTLSALAAAACSKAPENAVSDAAAIENAANSALPDDRTSLPGPSGPIDPKSAEAAQNLVQQFADRLQSRRFRDAYTLISGSIPSWKELEFVPDYSSRKELAASVGQPSVPEGAAGSVYVTVPMEVSGKYQSGEPFRETWSLTLRRVNDVPGSSEAQRRWHIARIERN